MLLDEDPATLINHTINNFNTGPDKQAISRIQDSLSTLKQARDLRARDAETSLKKLSRSLTALQSQHDELVSTHSSSGHASEIARLDTQKFRIAKAASDLEVEAERLGSNAADLTSRLQELEMQGEDGYVGTSGESGGGRGRQGSTTIDDEVLLRLRVYRSLGIDIERDAKEGEFSKAVVRNDRKGDVHVVNLDKKFSRFFYANYFWNTL